MPAASRLLLVACVLTAAGTSRADSLSRGSVALESRGFDPDSDPKTDDYGFAVSTHLEIKYDLAPLRLVLRGFGRFDAVDKTHQFLDIEEANISYEVGRVLLRIGDHIVDWGANTALRPSDMVNSRNFDSDIEKPEEIGEPMAEIRFPILQGTFSVYFMPLRIPSHYPADSSRLSFIIPGAELGDAIFLDRDGTKSTSWLAPQEAARLTQTIGPVDISIYGIDHSDRLDPTFTDDPQAGKVRPTYHWQTQVGFTYVQVAGPMQIRFEGARRFWRDPDPIMSDDVKKVPDYNIVAGGLEYGWTTGSGHDAAVFLEGQSVLLGPQARKDADLLQRDMLLAYRENFNDVKSRQFQVGILVDADTPNEYVLLSSYSQSLTDTWSVLGSVHTLRLYGKDLQELQLNLTRNF